MKKPIDKDTQLNFGKLIDTICITQSHLQKRALQSVNQFLTIRNWLIGYYIAEYEQKGKDRAKYGESLLDNLSKGLKKKRLKGFSSTNLKLFRQFYFSYPQIGKEIIEQKLFAEVLLPAKISQTLSDQSVIAKKSSKHFMYNIPPELLFRHFSFSHFIELMRVEEPLKRAFYEIENIKGQWGVRQLKRQIESLLYERTGLSKNKKALLEKIYKGNNDLTIEDTIRDPYILEFTGLKELPEYTESDLETALLNHIQDFLLELGDGFCFEARQKRISLENEHDRIDLVFYHRLLRCHVLIDLKIRKFNHTDVGQMNFYLNYYKKNIMNKNENQPIGIILCTDKNTTRVEYALAGLNNKVFVSKYKIALPSEKVLEEFIKNDIERVRYSSERKLLK